APAAARPAAPQPPAPAAARPDGRIGVLRHVQWDGRTLGPWAEVLDGAHALVNLAGRNVNCRYHARNRDLILRSRLDSVAVLGQAIEHAAHPPKVWVQATTLAIHGDRGDEVLDDDAPTGKGFSPD